MVPGRIRIAHFVVQIVDPTGFINRVPLPFAINALQNATKVIKLHVRMRAPGLGDLG
jgi:hypothetical protein